MSFSNDSVMSKSLLVLSILVRSALLIYILVSDEWNSEWMIDYLNSECSQDL